MPSLSFKARLNVKPLIWKWLFLLRRRKLIFTREVLRVAMVRKRGFCNSGNSLFFLLRKHGWTCYLHSWRSLVSWGKKNVLLANRQQSIFLQFCRPFLLKFLGKSCAREREKQMAPPWRHFLGLYSYRAWLSANQRARNRSVILKAKFEILFFN